MHALTWTNQPAQALAEEKDLQVDWNRLNAQRGDLPFLSSAAVVNALHVFGSAQERLLIARRGGRVAAMFVLENCGKLRWQTFQPSQLPLGVWAAEADLELDHVARDLLHRGPLKLCLALSVTQVDPLYAPRVQDDDGNRHDDYIRTAWVDIEGSFDDYWAARGKNLRQNMRKQRNKLQAEGTALEVRVLRDAVEMAGALARYGELEGSGWKAKEGTAILPDNAQGEFYTELMSTAAAAGEATVYELLFNGRTVASNLCMHRSHTLVILKTTYDESIHGYSPAFLLNQELIQILFAEKNITRLEYYGGLMEWHTRWTDNNRMLYHLTSFRHSLVKRLAGGKALATVDPAEVHVSDGPSTETYRT